MQIIYANSRIDCCVGGPPERIVSRRLAKRLLACGVPLTPPLPPLYADTTQMSAPQAQRRHVQRLNRTLSTASARSVYRKPQGSLQNVMTAPSFTSSVTFGSCAMPSSGSSCHGITRGTILSFHRYYSTDAPSYQSISLSTTSVGAYHLGRAVGRHGLAHRPPSYRTILHGATITR